MDYIKETLGGNTFTNYLEVPNELKNVPYGTTGYRMRFDSLDAITLRMGIVAALRSIFEKKTVGLMITASHNPECDNGIKVIDSRGEMLPADWEKIAMEVVHWSAKDFTENLMSKCNELDITFMGNYKGKVFIGGDTRKSTRHLSEIVKIALTSVGCEFVFFEFVTTPQLHFYVKLSNDKHISNTDQLCDIYFKRLSTAFCSNKSVKLVPTVLNVDCANGVGAPHLMNLSRLVSSHLTIKLYNTSTDNLNYKCGADYVKINQSVPMIHNAVNNEFLPGTHWCSIDGDVDRLIYFYISKTNDFQLLDGDRMAVLIADYLSELLRSELQLNLFTMAIVQTAYANSASTQCIENVLKIQSKCVPTGVKHLHKAAKEFDIGVYFEANGHGTVLFSEKMQQYASSLPDNHDLRQLIDMINEADGDAISDILVIEHILFRRNWTLEQWSAMYTDYPSRQLKVAVKDRNSIITTDAERKVQEPILLQNGIDHAVQVQLNAGVKHARAFVRPSGTEDIVRVYCESSTQLLADELANNIAVIISNILC